jgi:hypothetical protein
MSSNLIPEEKALANALLLITKKYGKFNSDNTGVWAGYTPASENEDNAKIGVKCGNCVFFNSPNGCQIVIAEVEDGGLCRFAVLPDGTVSPDKEYTVEELFSKPPQLVQEELKKKIKEMEDSYTEEYLEISDLIPTQDYLDQDNFKDAESFTKPITVYKDEDGLKLVDGHHRCASKVMAGQNVIKAKVYKSSKIIATGTPAEILDLKKIKKGIAPMTLEINTITADADGYGGECPPATQDIVLNIQNRQNAIDKVGYGPLNPLEPNDEFWQDKADRWGIEPLEARKSICGNCVFFDRRPKTLDCIETGLSEGGSGEQSAWDSIEQAELGYCTALDFKCAASRTCNAWAAGGPITKDTIKNDSVTATAGSKPAPKKDQIKGSDKNKKGSAKDGKSVNFTAAITKSLETKVKEHNEKAPNGRKVTLAKLKAVYRRGAGAFSTSHRPDQNRNSWAMARVNAFLHLVRTGSPKNKKYVTDNDLLPKMHPRSSSASSMSPLVASLMPTLNFEDLKAEYLDDQEEPWLD